MAIDEILWEWIGLDLRTAVLYFHVSVKCQHCKTSPYATNNLET